MQAVAFALCGDSVAGMFGLRLGFALQDRLDVVQFRRWMRVLLVPSGGNLIRRALQLGI
ncbi:MAG: hypothetical protein Q4G14_04065 [Paracoccus sp. (in: a-proteobacteria)]|uniref:hypothetical protein n=1 Tax=Paracoccus sp. TaxID=267 RepID=UPI0026DFE90C|nr:hypothetical protein [Paracoccus sp. (in: a-proteobacteria)]MDO5612404.1 hypothetical protein [Paracoccus sp. (in: a-proteobacteria)]